MREIISDVKEDGSVVQGLVEEDLLDSRTPTTLNNELEKYPNYVGYRLGTKVKGGQDTGNRALVILVEKKVSKLELKPQEVIPETIAGEKTDVQVFGKMPSIQPTIQTRTQSITEHIRPVPGNCSIGEESVTAGTAGFPAKRDGALGHFTNSHICLKNVRDDLKDQRPLHIFQPGPYDGGTPVVNYYADTVTAVVMPEGQPAFNDCGWAQGNAPNNIADYCHLMEKYTGHKLPAGLTTLKVGDKVFKIGRTTGYTEGNVVDLDTATNVNYGPDGVVLHKACLIFTNMSAGGDSGSAIYKMVDGKPYIVAYLFAGNGQYTIGHEIQNASSILRLTPLLEGDEEPPTPPQPPSPDKKMKVTGKVVLFGVLQFGFEAVIEMEEIE